ncbi:MAG TPA: TonB-dependent receptor [Cyclobacteriaceae bacterium]|nr:TonB-dependent receptor [Cyclobacteriaceae bacterium]
MTRRLLFCALVVSVRLAAQEKADTTRRLEEVVVSAYQYNRSLKESPVALGIASEKELNRFNNSSFVSTMNTIPGVRMEERSPGSYRFSIRGSTLRSPFGVRNVKFYWNGLPLTDGGGNTYLNLLDFDALGRVEVIKGPGGSLYGAGTGGVALLNNPVAKQNQFQFSTTGGSFGFQRYQASASFVSSKRKIFANYAHQQAEGYREQSAMRRDAFNFEGKFSLNEKNGLQASFFYTDLYYQTPGGLTLAQYNADPKQARPSGATPGAVQQQAAIYNKTLYGSSTLEHQWNPHWSSRIGAYGSYTDFTNPSILNYERRVEQNLGGRTNTQFDVDKQTWKGKLTFGAEYQYFYSPLTDYGNVNGVRDTVQTDDRLTSNSFLLFTQAEFDLPKNFYLTVGASGNYLKYNFQRLAGLPAGNAQRNFDPVVSPRVALLKKMSDSFSVFASVSKGFSAPSQAEVRPSAGFYNSTLSPEQGISYEVGFRGIAFRNFSFDIVSYDFELAQAIVSEKNIFNADYFVNAGHTSQKGIETLISYLVSSPTSAISYLKIWGAYTLTNYTFTDYQHDGINYSGNHWTGSPQNTIVGGADLNFKKFYWNLTANYVDRIPMNDANSVYAPDYFLVGSRIGLKENLNKASLEIFAGVDNALDQHYSLGNDLNATGGRYFNAAATRNFYFGIKFRK